MTGKYELYETRDALGGEYAGGPRRVGAADTLREAVAHITQNPQHHAKAPNGDILQWDGEAVVREPEVAS